MIEVRLLKKHTKRHMLGKFKLKSEYSQEMKNNHTGNSSQKNE